MREDGRLERITDDLFCIAERLKEVDPRYELFYNKRLCRFEIYAQGALQIAVPFDRLDERTVRLARETRRENMRRLIQSIDMENARLEAQKQREVRESALKRAEECL